MRRRTAASSPLFPLHTVLFPGGPLPLRIFETRYTDMVRRCMREQQPFGVVLIQDGDEAGAVATTATVGCTARIADFHTLHDGLLGITCVGRAQVPRASACGAPPTGSTWARWRGCPPSPRCRCPREYARLARRRAPRARGARRPLRARGEEVRRCRLGGCAARRAAADRTRTTSRRCSRSTIRSSGSTRW